MRASSRPARGRDAPAAPRRRRAGGSRPTSASSVGRGARAAPPRRPASAEPDAADVRRDDRAFRRRAPRRAPAARPRSGRRGRRRARRGRRRAARAERHVAERAHAGPRGRAPAARRCTCVRERADARPAQPEPAGTRAFELGEHIEQEQRVLLRVDPPDREQVDRAVPVALGRLPRRRPRPARATVSSRSTRPGPRRVPRSFASARRPSPARGARASLVQRRQSADAREHRPPAAGRAGARESTRACPGGRRARPACRAARASTDEQELEGCGPNAQTTSTCSSPRQNARRRARSGTQHGAELSEVAVVGQPHDPDVRQARADRRPRRRPSTTRANTTSSSKCSATPHTKRRNGASTACGASRGPPSSSTIVNGPSW